jgi:hypothetical protein
MSAWPDPLALFARLGVETVKQKAAAGDGEALWSLGYGLVSGPDAAARTEMGTAARTPKADVGLARSIAQFTIAH